MYPVPCEPKAEIFMPNRKKMDKNLEKVPMEEWTKRLALAPYRVIRKILEATTHVTLDVESYNRTIPKRHFKSRFPFFKNPRLWDEFHADAF